MADYPRKNPADEGIVGKAISGRKKQLEDAEAAALAGQPPPPPEKPEDPMLKEARKRTLIERLMGR